jgi:hypothetical protein
MMIEAKDAAALLEKQEFRRFLYAVIQSAGLLSNNEGADGRTVTDQSLEWHSGRRSLGHDILLMIEQGQPDALRSPDGSPVATLIAVLREHMNPKEKPNERNKHSDRYADIDADSE